MRSSLQVLVLVSAIVMACPAQSRAQTTSLSSNYSSQRPCRPKSPIQGDASDNGGFSVAALSFSGFLQMPVAEQEQIAAAIKGGTYAGSLDRAKGEIEERLRIEWLNRGYFRVEVAAHAQLLSSDGFGAQIAVAAQVQEGGQYRLEHIAFRGNRAISNVHALRNLFPIKDGEVFGREAIATGLEYLRKSYLEFGYINATPVPETRISDDDHKISLVVNIDEGKQFYVNSVEVVDVDESVLNDLVLKRGQIYNARLIQLFLDRQAPGLDVGDSKVQHLKLHERRGLVDVTLDLSSCRQ